MGDQEIRGVLTSENITSCVTDDYLIKRLSSVLLSLFLSGNCGQSNCVDIVGHGLHSSVSTLGDNGKSESITVWTNDVSSCRCYSNLAGDWHGDTIDDLKSQSDSTDIGVDVLVSDCGCILHGDGDIVEASKSGGNQDIVLTVSRSAGSGGEGVDLVTTECT